jgi:hypothetical protein
LIQVGNAGGLGKTNGIDGAYRRSH